MRHEGLKWETGLVFVVVVMICAAVESKEALCRERCGEVSKGKHSRVLQLTRRVEAKVYFIYCNQWSESVDAKLTFCNEPLPRHDAFCRTTLVILSQVPVWYGPWIRNPHPPRSHRPQLYVVMSLLWPESWNIPRKRLTNNPNAEEDGTWFGVRHMLRDIRLDPRKNGRQDLPVKK